MHPEAPFSTNSDPSKGLPPVAPPTGKFIVQLFLVPLLIVSLALLLVGGISWLVPRASTPEQFLKNLDDANAEVRWRGADDLAQTLLRDPQLAANPKFALDLSERLSRALARRASLAQAVAEQLRRKSGTVDPSDDAKALQAEQVYVDYLSACLGNFTIPAGAPLLGEMAGRPPGGPSLEQTRLRWRALWALANLGQNLKRFDDLPPARQEAVLQELELEARSGSERGEWANTAVTMLAGRRDRKPQAAGVGRVLAVCAADANPHVRANAALALTMWEGTPAENAVMEDLLVKLANDDGRGQELLDQFYRDDPRETQVTTRLPGLGIRHQAALGLARRGSARVPLALLADLLDEEGLRQNYRLRHKDGQEVPAEAAVREMVLYTLKAVVELHHRRPELDLARLRPAVEKLTEHPLKAVREEAIRVQDELAQPAAGGS